MLRIDYRLTGGHHGKAGVQRQAAGGGRMRREGAHQRVAPRLDPRLPRSCSWARPSWGCLPACREMAGLQGGFEGHWHRHCSPQWPLPHLRTAPQQRQHRAQQQLQASTHGRPMCHAVLRQKTPATPNHQRSANRQRRQHARLLSAAQLGRRLRHLARFRISAVPRLHARACLTGAGILGGYRLARKPVHGMCGQPAHMHQAQCCEA